MPIAHVQFTCNRILPLASFQGVASFHDVLNMYPQNITVRLKFSVQEYANCGAIAVIASMTYMTVVNTLPPSPLR